MQLLFMDGRTLDVITIFGGPNLIDGVMRDTLRIEVSPDTIGFSELKELFMDNPNTDVLHTITTSKDESGNAVAMQNKVGEGYNIFVSISDELRRLAPIPGTIESPKVESRYVVMIAQETYAERQLRILQQGG